MYMLEEEYKFWKKLFKFFNMNSIKKTFEHGSKICHHISDDVNRIK